MRQYLPAVPKRSWFRTILATVALVCVLATHGVAGSLPSAGLVVAVFDGDTVLLAGGKRVRYLGIDAPEVAHKKDPGACFGDEARRLNAQWVLHKKVTLRYDKQSHDAYGRLLAYVFTSDGRCVNAEMVGRGYACVFQSSESFSKFREFLDLQREAIRGRRGMWGGCMVEPSPYYAGNRKTFVFHRADCPFGKRISRRHRVSFQTRWMALEEGYRPARCCKP